MSLPSVLIPKFLKNLAPTRLSDLCALSQHAVLSLVLLLCTTPARECWWQSQPKDIFKDWDLENPRCRRRPREFIRDLCFPAFSLLTGLKPLQTYPASLALPGFCSFFQSPCTFLFCSPGGGLLLFYSLFFLPPWPGTELWLLRPGNVAGLNLDLLKYILHSRYWRYTMKRIFH